MLKELNLSKDKGLGSLNLSKGISLNLTKDNETLRKIQIGLGWQTRMDLDSIAVLMDKNNEIVDTIYFGHQNSKGIYLNGDDLTGGGVGDNEIIFADLSQIPNNVSKICLCANIFAVGVSSKTFKDVKQSFIRLVNSETKEELCKYSLEDDFANNTAVHFADLVRDENSDWKFITIGKGINGSIKDIEHYCKTGEIKEHSELMGFISKGIEILISIAVFLSALAVFF